MNLLLFVDEFNQLKHDVHRHEAQVVILDLMERLLHIGLSLCKQVPYLDVVVPLEACALQARLSLTTFHSLMYSVGNTGVVLLLYL